MKLHRMQTSRSKEKKKKYPYCPKPTEIPTARNQLPREHPECIKDNDCAKDTTMRVHGNIFILTQKARN